MEKKKKLTKKDTQFSKDKKGASGAVIAKSNTKRRFMTEALMLALNREVEDAAINDGKPTKKLAIIADRLANNAADGDLGAIKEIFDRTEGKAAQAIIHQGDADNPLNTKWTVEFINATPKDK